MDVLTQYSFWQLVAIVVSISAAAKAIYDFIFWILDKFDVYHNQRSKQERLEQQIKENTEKTEDIIKYLDNNESKMNKYFDIEKIMIRHTLISSCEEYITRGWLYTYELQACLDLYEVYKELGGNSYCTTMIDKIKELPIHQEP